MIKNTLLTLFMVAVVTVTANAGGVLDVDGDGDYNALTDGLLILRSMLGFDGQALVKNAVSKQCTRCTAKSIKQYLSSLKGEKPRKAPYMPGCRWDNPRFYCPPESIKLLRMHSSGLFTIIPR